MHTFTLERPEGQSRLKKPPRSPAVRRKSQEEAYAVLLKKGLTCDFSKKSAWTPLRMQIASLERTLERDFFADLKKLKAAQMSS